MMKPRFHAALRGTCCALLGLALGFAAPAARADIVWVLSDVTFSDGTMARGWFSLNPYGYPLAVDIVVTDGALPSYEFTSPSNPATYLYQPTNTIVFYGANSYADYLQLQFSLPLDTAPSGNVNTIVTAQSVECVGFCNQSTGPATGGFAETPEPASLPLIATALAGVLAVRRRRPA